MPTSKLPYPKQLERAQAEGRGTGVGPDYKPWFRVQEVSSRGRSHRIQGIKTKRIHHLLSDGERNVFLLLDLSPQVQDIREQYPCLEIKDAQAIAFRLGCEYPSWQGSPVVMTTDFLVTEIDGINSIHKAISVKRSEELADRRVLEKLEIERRFWADKRIPLFISSEKQFTVTLVKNLNLLHSNYELEGFSPEYSDALYALIIRSMQNGQIALSKVTTQFDNENGLAKGTALALAWHLVARRRLIADWRSPLDASLQIRQLFKL